MLPCLDLSRGESYYAYERPEILNLIPTTANKILDVGCGAGVLGFSVLTRQPCSYFGIEPEPAACAKAHNHLSRAFNSTAETWDDPSLIGYFDCIVFSDVLEHTYDPLEILIKFRDYLHENGRIIVSIPNIAHPKILRELSSGVFRYRTAGILDNDHKWHFTRLSAQQLLVSAGYHIKSITPYPSTIDPIQHLIVAQKIKTPSFMSDLTVVIPHYQTLQLLTACIDSVTGSGGDNRCVTVLDQGATAESFAYLSSRRDILSIDSPANFGFPIGCNLLLSTVSSPYILLLNSDVHLPKNSISRMLDIMENNKKVAMLGPVSQNVSGPQQVYFQSLSSPEELEAFTENLYSSYNSKLHLIHRLVFHAVMLRREVIETVGILDERFTPGNFEDDDLCFRAILAGFKLYYCPGIYVHHYGGASWKTHSIDYRTIMTKNQAIFQQKHGSRYETTIHDYYRKGEQ